MKVLERSISDTGSHTRQTRSREARTARRLTSGAPLSILSGEYSHQSHIDSTDITHESDAHHLLAMSMSCSHLCGAPQRITT